MAMHHGSSCLESPEGARRIGPEGAFPSQQKSGGANNAGLGGVQYHVLHQVPTLTGGRLEAI